jgi:two-component system NtrC family response regulator
MSKPRLLVVEDNADVRMQLSHALRDEYALWFATDRAEAMGLLSEIQPAVVSLDLGLPPCPDSADEGLALLDDMARLAPLARVVVVAGNADREDARRAVQLGAFDCHLKPIDLDEFRVVLRRAARLHDLARESERSSHDETALRFEEIVGRSPELQGIFAVIQRIARTDATVLIEGESGTGKELLARAVHSRSRRRDGPFISVNCGAIPEALLEAELFGHERGAFTGTVQRKGKFELADRGTLFLDEIGDLPVPLQVKLLRFLHERVVERMGARQPIPLDLRIVVATKRDLRTHIDRRAFREDLYYRLSVVRITAPPLRERGEDVILLGNVFLQRACASHRRRVRFGSEALRALLAHTWPGNVRELENRVNRAVIMARDRLIEPGDLDLEAARPAQPVSLRETRYRVEHEVLVDTLTRHRGNVSRSAQELQISRPTLHNLLEKHQIITKDYRRR